MLSKTDYNAIADALRDERDTAIAFHETYHAKGIAVAAKRLASVFGDANPRFDALHFLRACGLDDDEIGKHGDAQPEPKTRPFAFERPVLLDMSNPLQASIARARADVIEPASERVPQVHEFDSTSEAYDVSQCADEIRDGDVLVVRSERAVAIMLSAWPTAVEPGLEGDAFHVPDAIDWTRVPAIDPSMPSKSYQRSAQIAYAIVAELRGEA